MASSGTINNTFRTGYAIRIVWEIDSQDLIHNTSTVTARVQLVSLGSTYNIIASAVKYGTLTINGVTYSFTFNASLNGSQTKTLYTKTVTVAHESDGSKTCSMSTTCGINVTLTGVYWGNVTASGNGVFDTIGRASTISSVTPSIEVDGTNVIAVSIDSASLLYSHNVTWKFGSYSFTAYNAGDFISYAIPVEWLNAIPDATTGTGTVTVTTYSNVGDKIGASDYASFQLVVPASVLPSVTSIGITEATEGIAEQFGGYVQYKSAFNVSILAAGELGSTIKSYKTTVDGISYYGNQITSGVISKSGSVGFSFSITDSRGRTINDTRQRTVLPYFAPTISRFNVYRCNGDGTQEYEGCCVCVSTKFDIAPVNNLNSSTIVLEYKIKSETNWTTLDSGTMYSYDGIMILHDILTTDNSYDIRLTIEDFFVSKSTTVDIPTAFTLMDFASNGRGMAFGKVSELPDSVEFGLPAIFSYGESPYSARRIEENADLNMIFMAGFYVIPTVEIAETVSNKPWTGAETGFMHLFSVGTLGQRMQVCYKASKDDPGIWERCYYGGTWGSWHCIFNGFGKVLWSGGLHMNGTQTIPLSEGISKQPSGVELIFSPYINNEVLNNRFSHHFISKKFVAAYPGEGSNFIMANNSFSLVATKYIYISDNAMTGDPSNTSSGVANGIIFDNSQFVLRYVIGI